MQPREKPVLKINADVRCDKVLNEVDDTHTHNGSMFVVVQFDEQRKHAAKCHGLSVICYPRLKIGSAINTFLTTSNDRSI